MTKKQMPCYGCTDRTPTCHGYCKKYERARQILDEENKMRRDEMLRNDSCFKSWYYDARGVKFR